MRFGDTGSSLRGLRSCTAYSEDVILRWHPPALAGVETSLDTANTSVCATTYSFTCTTCAGSKPLKCVAEALLYAPMFSE